MTAMQAQTAARAAAGLAFPAALFASAALIFMLQPMFARMTTPLLGGSPAVWNTAMVFFQAALLAGYVYAHLLQRLRSLQMQAAVHLALLGLAALALPVWPTEVLGAPDVGHPAAWLLGVLSLSVGAPYAVASATAPLLQAWYARSGRPDSHDPYYLYAASNAGSILGLLAYPFAMEPLLGLQAQSLAWSIGYAAVAALIAACALTVANAPGGAAAGPIVFAGGAEAWRARLYWMAAAAVPSSLLIGVTQHLVTDIASAPFLWVPPLVIYLLTFVIAFRKGAGAPAAALLLAHVAVLALLVWGVPMRRILTVALHLGALFVCAWVCHAALASRRPAAARLTEFYMFVSLGGVLGGGITALASPVLFDQVWEYPLALAATALFRPKGGAPLLDARLGWAAFSAAAAYLVADLAGWLPHSLWGTALAAAAVVLNGSRPAAVAALVLLAAAAHLQAASPGASVLRERSFFGVMRVYDVETPGGTMRLVSHGTQVHGAQWVDPDRAAEPISYYHPSTTLNEAVRAALPAGRADVAVLGLGAGTLACVLRAGDAAVYYEIDPAMARIARDPAVFTFLTRCPAVRDIVLGDARIRLAQAQDASLDLIVADAFSSDSIPTHLLTREAIRLYMRKLRQGGVLVLHVSNWNLAIENEVARVAQAEGLAFRIGRSERLYPDPAREFEASGGTSVVLVRGEDRLAAMNLGPRWLPAPAMAGAPWSDDRIDVLRALRERPIALAQ